MTPLIDVVFILLMFFMLATRFDHYRRIEINSSGTAQGDTVDSPSATHRIRIGTQDRYWLDLREVSLIELESGLRALGKKEPGLAIHVRSDRHSRLQQTVGVMDILKRQGIEQVELLTGHYED